MKKIVFYIPAIIFTFFFGWVAIRASIGSISPAAAVWLVLFSISGILLSKKMFWGSLLGALPAIHMIYMGATQYRQVINELPIGVIVLIFYIICGSFVFYKNKKTNDLTY